jgi:DNA-binding NtrC family response regulator
MAKLISHRWPGNVRELKNYVQATVAMGEAALLQDRPGAAPATASSDTFAPFLGHAYGTARAELLHAFERVYLEQLMQKTHGNVAQAAREAQMARSHLNELLRRHKIR